LFAVLLRITEQGSFILFLDMLVCARYVSLTEV